MPALEDPSSSYPNRPTNATELAWGLSLESQTVLDMPQGSEKCIEKMSQTQRGVPLNWEELRSQAYELLEKHKKTKTCPMCGKKVVWPQRVYCSHKCSHEFSVKYFGRQWDTIRREIIKRDNHTCRRCGRTHSKRELESWNKWHAYCGCEVDHIVEIERGGTDDPANLQTLCSKCHRIKTNAFIRKIRKTPAQPEIALINPEIAQLEPFQELLKVGA